VYLKGKVSSEMDYSVDKKGCLNGEPLINVDDLLDFSNEGEEEVLELGCEADDVAEGNFSADTSTVSTAVDSCNSFSGDHCFAGAGLSGDLCEPVNILMICPLISLQL
jgi:hypothetical protein